MSDQNLVWVLDTSTFLELKRSVIPANQQWRVFRELETMAEKGDIALPRQVINELTTIAHPDVPGAWAHGVRGKCKHPIEVDLTLLPGVMSQVGAIVDKNKQRECADPYVLALALQLQAAGYQVCVVTSDTVDRPPIKMSLAWGCRQLGLTTRTPEIFVQWVGLI